MLIFTAVVPGYFADVCQAKGQESVGASESQVLLAGEPLFAAVMGAVLLGESLGTFGYVGGAPGMVDLYVGKTVVRSGIPNEDACDALVELIKENDRWVEPSEVEEEELVEA